MVQIMNVSLILSEWIEMGLSAQNEALTLPNFTTLRIALYNEFRDVRSIREYPSKVAETY